MKLAIALDEALARATPRLREKMEHTINLLRKAERLALKYSPDGFLLGMSGGKDSILISPIIEWLDSDVWELLNDVLQVPHCELYDQGSIRTGCLFCPMASPREKAIMRQRYPRVERAYKNAIKELVIKRPQSYNELDPYVKDIDTKVDHIFDWWVGNDTLAKYISEHFVQQHFDF